MLLQHDLWIRNGDRSIEPYKFNILHDICGAFHDMYLLWYVGLGILFIRMEEEIVGNS